MCYDCYRRVAGAIVTAIAASPAFAHVAEAVAASVRPEHPTDADVLAAANTLTAWQEKRSAATLAQTVTDLQFAGQVLTLAAQTVDGILHARANTGDAEAGAIIVARAATEIADTEPGSPERTAALDRLRTAIPGATIEIVEGVGAGAADAAPPGPDDFYPRPRGASPLSS
jgi:hypothetical protein